MTLKPGPRGNRGPTHKEGLVLRATQGSAVLSPGGTPSLEGSGRKPPITQARQSSPILRGALGWGHPAHRKCLPALEGPAQGSQAP